MYFIKQIINAAKQTTAITAWITNIQRTLLSTPCIVSAMPENARLKTAEAPQTRHPLAQNASTTAKIYSDKSIPPSSP